MNGIVSEEYYVENRVKVIVGNVFKVCMYLKVNIIDNFVNMFIDIRSFFLSNMKELVYILGYRCLRNIC